MNTPMNVQTMNATTDIQQQPKHKLAVPASHQPQIEVPVSYQPKREIPAEQEPLLREAQDLNPNQSTQKKKTEVSGEQELDRLREAQNLKLHLEGILKESDSPNAQILDDALMRAEQLSSESAKQHNIDPETRKTFEDISELLTSARNLGKDKGIVDRLQRIADETTKALEASRREGVSNATKERTQEILNYITASRPVFKLLMSSRVFRRLILDSIGIAKRILYTYGEDIGEESQQKFVELASAGEITRHLRERTQQKEIPDLTEQECNTLLIDIQRVSILLSREPSYLEGVDRIFNLLDMFQNSILKEEISYDITSDILPEEIHLRSAVRETEELVAKFSGRHTFEKFKNHLRNLIVEIQKDEKLNLYLSELKGFILKSKSEEEIRSDAFRSETKELAYRGRDLMRELRAKEDLKKFLESADDLIENIMNDELLSILRHHAGVVQSDLSYEDSEGRLHVDTNMLSKLRTVLMPVITDAFKYIPLPRIESHTLDRDFTLDNVVLCGYDIIPETIIFRLEYESEVCVREVEVKRANTNLVISMDLRTELKNIDFTFHKKTFPQFNEQGKFNLSMKGDGARLTFRYEVEQGPHDNFPQLKQGYASFDISNLSIDFDTNTLKHDVLVPILTVLFKPLIKHEIEREIENNLTHFVLKMGDLMSTSLAEMNRPIFSQLDVAKKAVKSSLFAEMNEKRSKTLE